MKAEIKQQIIIALEQWIADHKVSQNDLAKLSKINASYLIAMRKGEYSIKTGDKEIEIKNEYFTRLANYIGFELQKPEVGIKETPELITMCAKIKNARDLKEFRNLIGETGAGKTFAIEVFERKYPQETFVVKTGSTDNIQDLVTKILQQFIKASDVKYFLRTGRSNKIRDVLEIIDEMNRKGLMPTLIVDECEFMKVPSIMLIKDLLDFFAGKCGLVTVGTPEFLRNIEKLVLKKAPGAAQFARRIKFKTYRLPKIDASYSLFLQEQTAEVKNWLTSNCNNYGELVDVLRPCIRESERLAQPITVQFIKTVMGL